ncbi:hypothetical protein HDU83_007597 [Entophlyctis luteolus]|nr:hypothetical protein HDU83_007597 [Entophlyctis luteolus]
MNFLAIAFAVASAIAAAAAGVDLSQSLRTHPAVDSSNFKASGSVSIFADRVRVVPSIPDAVGSIWFNEPNPHAEWEVTFSFAVSAPHVLGGEGMAIWYARETQKVGSVYGSIDNWTGLLVALDSSSGPGRRHVPLVYAMNNKHGELSLSPRVRGGFPPDGNDSLLGRCFRDYRNTPHKVFGRIRYEAKTLTVEMDINQGGNAFSECFKKANVELPKGYHFGITASTFNDYYDDHDLFSFEVRGLNEQNNVNQDANSEELTAPFEEKSDREEVPRGFYEAFNEIVIRELAMGQQKMINSLNIILERFGRTPMMLGRMTGFVYAKHAEDSFKSMSIKTEDVTSKIGDLIGQAGTMRDSVREIIALVQAGLAKDALAISHIDKSVDAHSNQIDETGKKYFDSRPTTNNKDMWIIYVLFFAVGGVFVYAVSVAMRAAGKRGAFGGGGY